MTYRFLLFCEEVENFVMELMASPNTSFLELHRLILKECDYSEIGNHKFIVCDENWKPKEKVHLSNDDKVGFDEDMYLMEEAVLEDFIEDNAQRIAYIYDTDGRRKFLLELVEQIFGENTERTYIRRRKGTPPTQFLKNTEIDNIMPSIGATSADEIDTEESTTEDSFSEDELDLEGFEVSEQ